MRSLLLSIFAAFALVACGPSAAQVKTARTAQYQTSASTVFQAAVDALEANDYKIKAADPVAARAITVERWYEPDGTSLSRDSDGRPLMSSAGAVVFAIEVGVVSEAEGVFRVDVLPHVLQQRDGYSSPLAIKPDDPAMPGWVHGKVDNVYLSIYGALKGSAKVAAP